MEKLTSTVYAGIWACGLAVVLYACSGSEFGGDSGKTAASLRDKNKGKDAGDDGNDGADSDAGDSDSGGNDSGGGGTTAGGTTSGQQHTNCTPTKDTNKDGKLDKNDCPLVGGTTSSGGNTGPGSDGGDSSGGDSDIGGDSDSTGGGGNDSLGTDGDELSAKLWGDAIITAEKRDDKFQMTFDALLKGNPAAGHHGDFTTAKDDDKGPWVVPQVCRRGKKTCWGNIIFTNRDGDDGHTEQLGGSACAVVKSSAGNTVRVHADTNGAGIIGSCGGENDEELVIQCPDSTELQLGNCNG